MVPTEQNIDFPVEIKSLSISSLQCSLTGNNLHVETPLTHLEMNVLKVTPAVHTNSNP